MISALGHRSPTPRSTRRHACARVRGRRRGARVHVDGRESIHSFAHAFPALAVIRAESNCACRPIVASNFLPLRSSRSRSSAAPLRRATWSPGSSLPVQDPRRLQSFQQTLDRRREARLADRFYEISSASVSKALIANSSNAVRKTTAGIRATVRRLITSKPSIPGI